MGKVRILIVSLLVIWMLTPCLAELSSVRLTIFTRDLMQIKETHSVTLNSGIQTLIFPQPIPHLSVSSLRIDPVVSDASVRAISSLYQQEALDMASIWGLYNGRWVSFQQGSEVFRGKLIRVTDTHIYLQPDSTMTRVEIIDKNVLNSIAFDSLPAPAAGSSRFEWKAFSRFDQTIPVRISYMTSGANWRAAYHLWLTDPNAGLLQGEYSIENTTSRNFMQAEVELIAGDPQLTLDDGPIEKMVTAKSGTNAASTAWQGYQRYLLPSPVDLPAHSAVQMELLPVIPVAGETRYILENATVQSATIHREFTFHLPDSHQQALPWGEVTIYGDTVNGGTFIGEDYLGPASSGSLLSVSTGGVFDLSAKKERISYQRKNRNDAEETYRISISSAMSENITLVVREAIYGNWRLLHSNSKAGTIDPTTTNAAAIEWQLKIPAQSEEILEYSLEKTR